MSQHCRVIYLGNVIFEVLGHVSVCHICQVVEGLWPPAIDPVQLEQETGLAVVVAVVLLSDAFDVTSLQKFCFVSLHYST